MRNAGLKFVCRDQWLRVENTSSVWTPRYEPGAEILIPVKNAEGRYVADAETSRRARGREPGAVPVRRRRSGRRAIRTARCDDIAGICSADGRIAALMPHPEHAIDALTGPTDDGLGLSSCRLVDLAAMREASRADRAT